LPAKQLAMPLAGGLAVDGKKRVYWASLNTGQVQRFTPGEDGGVVETLLGRFQGVGAPPLELADLLAGDGTAVESPLGYPVGVAVAPDGSLYISELGRSRVCRVTGLDEGKPFITRVAGRSALDLLASFSAVLGGGEVPPDPAGGKADESMLVYPVSLTFDADGNLYIAEAGSLHLGALATSSLLANDQLGSLTTQGMPHISGRIRKVNLKDPSHPITTIAGRGSRFFPDDEGDNALLLPWGLAIAPDGRLAISDLGANMIRILPAGSY
jgi:hypothetical protein